MVGPAGLLQAPKINHLVDGETPNILDASHFVSQTSVSLSEGSGAARRSRPRDPPVKRNAALTGHQDGAKQIGKKRAASRSQKYVEPASASTLDDDRARVVRAKHQEIAIRYAWDARVKKRRRRPGVLMRVRLRELERLFAHRWGNTLPDDDAGRDDLLVAAHHIAQAYGNPTEHIPAWVREWAPWLSDSACAALVAKVEANPLKWTADKLAWRVRLTDAERTALKITTIGAIDCGKVARQERRHQRNNEAKTARRREGGAVRRSEYEGVSASRERPWEAVGMSRATWYRRGKPAAAPEAVRQVRVQQKKSNMLYPQLSHDDGCASAPNADPSAKSGRGRARCPMAAGALGAPPQQRPDRPSQPSPEIRKEGGDISKRGFVPLVPPRVPRSLPAGPPCAERCGGAAPRKTASVSRQK